MLGGMSWESTALYYRVANELVRDRFGGLASANLLVRSVDFAQVRELQVQDRWDDATDLLLTAAKALEVAGAELVILCTNYMHKTAPAVAAGLDVPLLHIADVAADAARAVPAARVGLVGADATMSEPFYADRLRGHGLDVLIPDDVDRRRLDRAIFDELCRGIVSDQTRAELREILARLVRRGAEAIVLACTELELLLGPDDCTVPQLPTARLHVGAAIDASLRQPVSPS